MRTMLLLALLLVPMASANLEIEFGDDCGDCDEPTFDYDLLLYTMLVVLFLVIMIVIIAAAASD